MGGETGTLADGRCICDLLAAHIANAVNNTCDPDWAVGNIPESKHSQMRLPLVSLASYHSCTKSGPEEVTKLCQRNQCNPLQRVELLPFIHPYFLAVTR